MTHGILLVVRHLFSLLLLTYGRIGALAFFFHFESNFAFDVPLQSRRCIIGIDKGHRVEVGLGLRTCRSFDTSSLNSEARLIEAKLK